jgi:hypothetical protein
LKAKSIIDLQS